MSKFEERSGIIYLHPDEGEAIAIPLDWWLTQEQGYISAPRREYLPGERHSVWDASGQGGGELPWEEGDVYLGKIAQYAAAYQAYLAANAPEPEPDPVLPDWGQFRTLMLFDSAFRRITSNENAQQLDVAAIATEINKDSPSVIGLQIVMNALIAACPEAAKPTESEIAAWQGYADAALTGLEFDPLTAELL